MLEVAVVVDKVECSRLSDAANETSKSNYRLNVALSEKMRRPSGLTLEFTLDLVGTPQLAKITVSGSAKLTGSDDEIAGSISAGPESSTPKIVETIYEKLYGLIYLLAGSMRVPYPLPNLLKKSG